MTVLNLILKGCLLYEWAGVKVVYMWFCWTMKTSCTQKSQKMDLRVKNTIN